MGLEMITYPKSEIPPSAQDLSDVVRLLCEEGIPKYFDDEIVSFSRLLNDERLIGFAFHRSLGQFSVDTVTQEVIAIRPGKWTFVNTTLRKFKDCVERFYRMYSEVTSAEDYDEIATTVIHRISEIDAPAAGPGTFWDSVRESISIGDWHAA